MRRPECAPAGDHASAEPAATEAAATETHSTTAAKCAGEGCASKAIATGAEHAPARDHATTEAAASGSATTEAAAAEMHSATTEPTVHATESTTPAKCHGLRWKGDCRSEHGCGEATENFAFHEFDPL